MSSELKRRAMLQISSAAILLLAALGIYFYYQSRPLNKERLKVLVGDLRSTASEANLLTDQIQQQKVKPTYTYEHLGMMIEAAKKTSDQLKKSKVQNDLVSKKEITQQTAQELVTGLEKIQKDSVQTQDFEKLFQKLNQVEESLE